VNAKARDAADALDGAEGQELATARAGAAKGKTKAPVLGSVPNYRIGIHFPQQRFDAGEKECAKACSG